MNFGKYGFPPVFHIMKSEKESMCGVVSQEFKKPTDEELQITQRHCSKCHKVLMAPKPEYNI